MMHNSGNSYEPCHILPHKIHVDKKYTLRIIIDITNLPPPLGPVHCKLSCA